MDLKKNPFLLAPMAGITDSAFRIFMKRRGASYVISELISATAITYQSEKTLKMLNFSDEEQPLGIQLFGEDADKIAEAARIVEAKGAHFIDLNFGCPVPKVVKKGAGSGALKDLSLLKKILQNTVGAVKIPVTLKVRTGWDALSMNSDQVAEIAYNEGATWMVIHGRTRAQNYQGKADWEYIRDVKRKSRIPVIGNGDISSAGSALQRLIEFECDAVMIGRGALKNPWIFQEALNLYNERERIHQNLTSPDNKQRDSNLKDRYWKDFLELSDLILMQNSDRIAQIQLKKFAIWWSSGYPEASQLRKKLFQAQTIEEIKELAETFLTGPHFKEKILPEADFNEEKFLMGGHG